MNLYFYVIMLLKNKQRYKSVALFTGSAPGWLFAFLLWWEICCFTKQTTYRFGPVFRRSPGIALQRASAHSALRGANISSLLLSWQRSSLRPACKHFQPYLSSSLSQKIKTKKCLAALLQRGPGAVDELFAICMSSICMESWWLSSLVTHYGRPFWHKISVTWFQISGISYLWLGILRYL